MSFAAVSAILNMALCGAAALAAKYMTPSQRKLLLSILPGLSDGDIDCAAADTNQVGTLWRYAFKDEPCAPDSVHTPAHGAATLIWTLTAIGVANCGSALDKVMTHCFTDVPRPIDWKPWVPTFYMERCAIMDVVNALGLGEIRTALDSLGGAASLAERRDSNLLRFFFSKHQSDRALLVETLTAIAGSVAKAATAGAALLALYQEPARQVARGVALPKLAPPPLAALLPSAGLMAPIAVTSSDCTTPIKACTPVPATPAAAPPAVTPVLISADELRSIVAAVIKCTERRVAKALFAILNKDYNLLEHTPAQRVELCCHACLEIFGGTGGHLTPANGVAVLFHLLNVMRPMPYMSGAPVTLAGAAAMMPAEYEAICALMTVVYKQARSEYRILLGNLSLYPVDTDVDDAFAGIARNYYADPSWTVRCTCDTFIGASRNLDVDRALALLRQHCFRPVAKTTAPAAAAVSCSSSSAPAAATVSAPTGPVLPFLENTAVSPATPDGDDACVICLENKKTVIMLRCGHVTVCASCYTTNMAGKAAQTCQLCRKPVSDATNAYM